MPLVRLFECQSLVVLDWHCLGQSVGAGTVELSPAYEVSVGRVGGHAYQFSDGEAVADTAGLLLVHAAESFRPIRRVRGLDRRTRILLSANAVRDLARDTDPRAADAEAPRFSRRYVPLSARAALAHHALIERASTAGDADPLAVHELAFMLAREAFSALGKVPPRVTRPVRDAVHAVQETLAARYSERIGLAELAHGVGLSPWHLSRSFHAQVGMRLHQYLTRVRLLAVLERMRDQGRADLTRIALDVGFSSHSHMTSACRRFFGVPPSRLAMWRMT